MAELPLEGYLRLPLRLDGGSLRTCSLNESIERFLQLNLNIPLQGDSRPKWLCAEPDLGCRVPHLEFDAVVQTLHHDSSLLELSVESTVRSVEQRLVSATAHVTDVPADDPCRRSRDGAYFVGPMKRVTIRAVRIDGEPVAFHYEVAFAGRGPVFPDEP